MPKQAIAFRKVSGPDPILVKDQLETLQGLWRLWGPEAFLRFTIWILAKKGTKASIARKRFAKLVPFSYNRIQHDIELKLTLRNIFLKPRQVGLTTWVLLRRLFVPCIITPGSNSFLISQSNAKATEHFRIIQRAKKFFAVEDPADDSVNDWNKDLLANLLHTTYSNRKEIIFDQIDSSCTIGSAEVEEAGQGCLGIGTWVPKADYTVDKIKNIVVGDSVIDEHGNKVIVSKTFIIPAEKHPYKGKAISWRAKVRGADFITSSPNHEFLTQRGKVEAQKLTIDDFIAYPKKYLAESKTKINFQQRYGNKISIIGRVYQCPGDEELELTREFGLACGFYLGDGSGGKRGISYVMANPRKIKNVLPRLVAFFAATNIGDLHVTSWRSKLVRLNNTAFARFIEVNFGHAKNKHVPSWWIKAPKEFLRGLLEGWLQADGYFPRKYTRLKDGKQCRVIEGYGKNARIVFAMRDIAIALGVGMPGLKITDKPDSRIVINGIECNNIGRKYTLIFSNQSFEGLQQVFKWIKPIGITQGRKTGFQYQTKDYVYVKIDKIKKTRVSEFRDFEVASKSHLYCLVNGVTHNSTLSAVACSEIARWPGNPEETLGNLKEALTLDGTLDLESTANDAGGYFYDECMRAEKGQSEFTFHFHPWWYEPKYRIELSPKELKELAADLTSDELVLQKKFKLDLQQIAFRRNKQISLRHNFPEKYPEDSISAFLVQGTGFFDTQILRLRLLELQGEKPLFTFGNGECKIFKKVIPGRRYIIGADPASGKQVGSTDHDWSYAKVIDLETGEEVAAYMARLSTVDFGLDLIRIGTYFNNAVIAVERGGGPEAAEGGTVILTLVQNSYPGIYSHTEWFKRNKKNKEVTKLEGFPTNAKTRPVALNRLKQFVDEQPALIHDVELVRQCLVFTRNEKGRPAAMVGQHDDAVMSSAIAQCVRLILMGYIDPLQMASERYGEFEGDEEED